MISINEELLKQNLAQNLRYLRLSQSPRLSQLMLARRTGSSPKSISNYEMAYYLPPVHILMALSLYFGLTMEELLKSRVPERKITDHRQIIKKTA